MSKYSLSIYEEITPNRVTSTWIGVATFSEEIRIAITIARHPNIYCTHCSLVLGSLLQFSLTVLSPQISPFHPNHPRRPIAEYPYAVHTHSTHLHFSQNIVVICTEVSTRSWLVEKRSRRVAISTGGISSVDSDAAQQNYYFIRGTLLISSVVAIVVSPSWLLSRVEFTAVLRLYPRVWFLARTHAHTCVQKYSCARRGIYSANRISNIFKT